jgi:predicted cupin superfamily sugar epimerase
VTPEAYSLPPHPEGGSYRETWRALLLDLGGTGATPALERTVVVGPGPEDLQRLVQPDEWQAARPESDEAVLVACVVSPGFDIADVELSALQRGETP